MPTCAPPGCAGVTTVGGQRVAAARCTPGQRWKCKSRTCAYNFVTVRYECGVSSCTDGLSNAWETGIDCGGGCPSGCVDGGACFNGEDCKNFVCLFGDAYDPVVRPGVAYNSWLVAPVVNGIPTGTQYLLPAYEENLQGGTCIANTCSDTVQNGPSETDVDCGNVACCGAYAIKRNCPWLCDTGKRCNFGTDCHSNRCIANPTVSSSKFCAASDMSQTSPNLASRIQGGTVIYGHARAYFDPQPNLEAVGFMIDVPSSQITQDATTDVQRPVEQGNLSYLVLRLSKGWQPGHVSLSDDDSYSNYAPSSRRLGGDSGEEGGKGGEGSEGAGTDKELAAAALVSSHHHLRRDVVEAEARRLVLERVPQREGASAGSGGGAFAAGAAAAGLGADGPDEISRTSGGALPRLLFRSWPPDAAAREAGAGAGAHGSRGRGRSGGDGGATRFELSFELGEGRGGQSLSAAQPRPATEFERGFTARYGAAALEDFRAFQLADLDGLAAPAAQPFGARALALAPFARALAAGNPSYNLTHTDTVVAVASRYLLNVQPDEVSLIIARSTEILGVSLLPGGWPAEMDLLQRLDWLEQDKAFCMEHANYSLADFNQTNADCSAYIFSLANQTNCTDAVTGAFISNSTNCSGNLSVSLAAPPPNPAFDTVFGAGASSPFVLTQAGPMPARRRARQNSRGGGDAADDVGADEEEDADDGEEPEWRPLAPARAPALERFYVYGAGTRRRARRRLRGAAAAEGAAPAEVEEGIQGEEFDFDEARTSTRPRRSRPSRRR